MYLTLKNEQYIGDEFSDLLWLESYSQVKPLKIPIDNTPNQILNKYSRTNFAKSYAIIRMLRSIAGKQNYESAIKKLMNNDQPSVSVFYNALVLVSCLNFLFIYSHSFYFKLNFQNQ